MNLSVKLSIRIQETPLYREAASNPFEMEKWGRKRKDIQDIKMKKKQYNVYTGQRIVNVADEIIEIQEEEVDRNYRKVVDEKSTYISKIKQKNKIFKTKIKRIPKKIQFKGFNRSQSAIKVIKGKLLNTPNKKRNNEIQITLEHENNLVQDIKRKSSR